MIYTERLRMVLTYPIVTPLKEMTMQKFSEWFYSKRKPVGYTIGVLNILVSLNHLLNNEYGLFALWLTIGATIIFDTKEYK
jgi:hypothetical protein